MLSMRLMRFGAKHKPFYYLVAIDSDRPMRSKYVEKLGFYDPMVSKNSDMRFKFNTDRVAYRLSVGAQPSDRVKILLMKAGFDFSPFPKIKLQAYPTIDKNKLTDNGAKRTATTAGSQK